MTALLESFTGLAQIVREPNDHSETYQFPSESYGSLREGV